MINTNNKMLFFVLSANLFFLGLSLSWVFDENVKFSEITFSQISNTQLIFVSFEKPEKIKNFAQAHKLNIYPNVHFLYDEKMNFTKTFDVAGLPTIVIYDKKQKLIEKIKGEIKVAKILTKINEK